MLPVVVTCLPALRSRYLAHLPRIPAPTLDAELGSDNYQAFINNESRLPPGASE